MPNDESGQVFDVSKPQRSGPTPTSKPIIVGHQPMMSDPMVKDASSPEPPMPASQHKAIPISTPGDDAMPTEPAMTQTAKEITPPDEVMAPADLPAEQSPSEPIPPAMPEAQPATPPALASDHPESVKAAAAGGSPTDQTLPPSTPPGDLHLMPVDDLIGHNHHGSLHHQNHHQALPQEHHTDKPPKTPKSKKYKTPLWILLILLILVGAYLAVDAATNVNLPFQVFKNAAPAPPPAVSVTKTTVTKTSTTDPYAGWKTYNLINEKLSFEYPTTWTLKDTSAAANDKGDSITFNGPNNFVMTINTGIEDYTLPTGGAIVDFADPIAFLGQQGYMDFTEVGKQNTSTISFINLSSSNTDPTKFFATKNVAGSNIKVAVSYQSADGKSNFTKKEAFYKSDSNYIDSKLLLQSMHY